MSIITVKAVHINEAHFLHRDHLPERRAGAIRSILAWQPLTLCSILLLEVLDAPVGAVYDRLVSLGTMPDVRPMQCAGCTFDLSRDEWGVAGKRSSG
jgi:hypothetical protein